MELSTLPNAIKFPVLVPAPPPLVTARLPPQPLLSPSSKRELEKLAKVLAVNCIILEYSRSMLPGCASLNPLY